MRVLVGYASRFGSTRDIAIRIADAVRARGNLVDVRSVDEISDFDRYDAVVFGSGVYDGSWTAEAAELMRWFSVWLPLVSQLVVPVSLLPWLAFARHATKARSIVVATLVATYGVAIGIAGLWLVIPWWLPCAYGVMVVGTIARRLRRNEGRRDVAARKRDVPRGERRQPGADQRASGHASASCSERARCSQRLSEQFPAGDDANSMNTAIVYDHLRRSG